MSQQFPETSPGSLEGSLEPSRSWLNLSRQLPKAFLGPLWRLRGASLKPENHKPPLRKLPGAFLGLPGIPRTSLGLFLWLFHKFNISWILIVFN